MTASAGARLKIEGGMIAERGAAGAPVGTVITVEHLFYNTPARLKFLKADSTERRHIDTILARYAMAYPNVRFTLSQDGRVSFTTSGNGDLADVLVEALGLEIMRDMVAVSPLPPPRPDLPEIAVYGYTSLPHLNRNTRGHITLFVNGRSIQDSSLTYATAQAYHTLMPADRYPISVLLITLDPSEVDVNVHPTKAEVRFRSPDAVFGAVQRAVRRVVISRATVPTYGGVSPTDAEGIDTPAPWRTASEGMSTPSGATSNTPEQLDFEFPSYSAGRYATQITPPRAKTEYEPLREEDMPPADLPRRTLPPMRVIGQLAATYILAEGPAALYLVDQHAAHERILYEQYMREFQSRQMVTQQTLEGITVQLTPASARLAEEYAASLNAVGFALEPFGGTTYRIRAIPAALARTDPVEAVIAVLGDLERGLPPGEREIEGQIVKKACKAGAIKAGQVLSFEEMGTLMRLLERCEHPRTCPHGRPTMILLTSDQLAKEFGRT